MSWFLPASIACVVTEHRADSDNKILLKHYNYVKEIIDNINQAIGMGCFDCIIEHSTPQPILDTLINVGYDVTIYDTEIKINWKNK